MTSESIARNLRTYNPYRIDEVYQVIKSTFPYITNGKQMTAEVVAPFIPVGACSQTWAKNMRDHEYRLDHPKPAPRKRRSVGRTPTPCMGRILSELTVTSWIGKATTDSPEEVTECYFMLSSVWPTEISQKMR